MNVKPSTSKSLFLYRSRANLELGKIEIEKKNDDGCRGAEILIYEQ